MQPGFSELGDLALKAGVPTALGCVIVWYLLWKHIPSLLRTFEKSMSDMAKINAQQRDECARASKIQSDVMQASIEVLRRQMETDADAAQKQRSEEGVRNRDALAALTTQTQHLAEAVNRMRGSHDIIDFDAELSPKQQQQASRR